MRKKKEGYYMTINRNRNCKLNCLSFFTFRNLLYNQIVLKKVRYQSKSRTFNLIDCAVF